MTKEKRNDNKIDSYVSSIRALVLVLRSTSKKLEEKGENESG